MTLLRNEGTKKTGLKSANMNSTQSDKTTVPKLQNYLVFDFGSRYLTIPELYKILLEYVPSTLQLKDLGFPYILKGLAMIKKQEFLKSGVKRIVADPNQKWCERCGQPFVVSAPGVYETRERCFYHWGKIRKAENFDVYLTCCKGSPTSKGCCTGALHVWSGLDVGINGPLKGFVRTTWPGRPECNIFGLDCEMGYSTGGLEVIRVTLLDVDGWVVYDTLVRPQHEVIDYNTRYSGISETDFWVRSSKSFSDVQQDLLGYITADSIIVGHALENDLRALKMVHHLVVDTAILFPHKRGLPYRCSLRDIAANILDRTIQTGAGHDSSEDARTCLLLVMQKIQQDGMVHLGDC